VTAGGSIHFAFLATVLALLCGVWLLQSALVFKRLSELLTLVDLDPADPAVWPRVSAIVPGRDEAASIGAALATRLDDDYPDLELVVVDDRSTDATPEIVARMAAADSRVVPIRVDEVPDGWLGKLNALERGTRAATGEWLLISDADIHFERGTLRKAVAFCEEQGRDFLALVPEFRSKSFAVNVLWATFIRILAMSLTPAGIRDPESSASAGSGSFMLMRRSAYDASPGFEHLRMETADDMALGMIIKQSGGRCEFMNGRDAAWLPSYPSIAAFMHGVEKNGSSLAGTPFPLVAAGMVLAGLVEYSPLITLGVGLATKTGWLTALGAATAAVATATAVGALWANTHTFVPALLWPIGWLGMATGVTRAAWLVHKRGGVVWRDTFYSTEEVLAGQRYKLGAGPRRGGTIAHAAPWEPPDRGEREPWQ